MIPAGGFLPHKPSDKNRAGKNPERMKNLIPLPARLPVPRDGVVVADAGKITAGPHSRMNHVARLIDRVRQPGARWRGRHDPDIEPIKPMFIEEITLEIRRFLM